MAVREANDEARALIEQTREALPGPESTERMAEFFKLLGEPTRVRILAALAEGELCVSDLAAALGMERTAVSHQLRLLRAARLVRARRDGKMICYSFDDDHVDGVFRLAREHIDHTEQHHHD